MPHTHTLHEHVRHEQLSLMIPHIVIVSFLFFEKYFVKKRCIMNNENQPPSQQVHARTTPQPGTIHERRPYHHSSDLRDVEAVASHAPDAADDGGASSLLGRRS